MIWLSGAHLRDLPRREDLGEMFTPNKGNRPRIGTWWAADTGLFSAKGVRSFDLCRYLGWLSGRRQYAHRCLFATAPDVMADAAATWFNSRDVLPQIRALGYRAALVAQDGLEHEAIDWDAFDCFFVGGSTAWKLSESAYALALEAQRRGKWTHLGRVNSFSRICAASLSGYDSADGTQLAFQPDNYLPKVLGWLNRLEAQQPLEVFA